MRHRKARFKLGRTGAHRSALFANQVSSLILEGQITTTLEKAKATRRLAEKMVTAAKKGGLADRRLAIAKIRNKSAVKKLFENIGTGFADRKGGYTRIFKIGKRKGDNAEKAILKWVETAPSSNPKPSDSK
jgi:large subunit ribosomal protein L17